LYPDTDAFQLNLCRKVPQYRLVGRVKIERGCDQQQARRVGAQRNARKISAAFELAAFQVPFDPHPVIQSLQRQVDVLASFYLDHHQPAVVVNRQQVQDAPGTGGKLRGLAVQRRIANAGSRRLAEVRTCDSSQASG